jgi:hypothetical protein
VADRLATTEDRFWLNPDKVGGFARLFEIGKMPWHPRARLGVTNNGRGTRKRLHSARLGPTIPKQLGANHQTCPRLVVHVPPDSTLEKGRLK